MQQAQSTKHALAQSLLELMSTKPLEQITVQELADACHLRRQSVYYHFSDLYAVVDWILLEARNSFGDSWDDFLSWQSYLTAVLKHMEDHRERYQPIVNTLGFDYVFRLFHKDLQLFLRKVILYYEPTPSTQEEFDFLLYYANTVTATLLERFIRQELPYTPEQLVGHLDTVIGDQVRGATLRYIDRLQG